MNNKMDIFKTITGLTKLGESNYLFWSKEITALLKMANLYQYVSQHLSSLLAVVDDKTTDQIRASNDFHKQREQQALLVLLMSCEVKAKRLIVDCDTAFDAWNILRKHFTSGDPNRANILEHKIKQLKLNKMDQVPKVLDELTKLIEEMSIADPLLNKNTKARYYLGVLDSIKFGSIKQSINMKLSKGEDIDYESVKKEILNQAAELNIEEEESLASRSINLEINKAKHQKRFYCACKCKGCGSNRTHPTAKCFHLKKHDTTSNEAFKRNHQINAIKIGNSNVRFKKLNVLLDSGATAHFVNDKTILSNIQDCSITEITGINKSTSQLVATQKGMVTFETYDKTTYTFEAFYCGQLEENYFSTALFGKQKNQLVVITDAIKRVQIDNEILIISYLNANNRYEAELKCIIPTQTHQINKLTATTTTWHERLAHAGSDCILKTSELAGFEVVEQSPEIMCRNCIINKKPIPNFSSAKNHANKVLECVHADLAGPFNRSIDGYYYYLNIIDEYSRFISVYGLTSKNEAAKWIQHYLEMAERFTEKKMVRFRSDNGGEFNNNPLKEIFIDKGITHEFSTAYTPQTNGIAERNNRTLKDDARTMMNSASLPDQFWFHAIRHAAYIRNRLVSSVHKQIPIMLWNKSNPDYDKIKIFGCKAYYHLPPIQVKSFDQRSTDAIYLGASYDQCKYILYDVAKKKCVSSRNAHIDESIFPYAHTEESSLIESVDDNTIDLDNLPIDPGQTIDPPVKATDTTKRPVRSTRGKMPQRFNEYVMDIEITNEINIPRTYEEAMISPYSEKWKQAMDSEMECLLKHGVAEVVELTPEIANVLIDSFWLFTVKRDELMRIHRFKARFTAKGFKQRPELDYKETYSPVASNELVRLMLTLAVEKQLLVHHFDVTTAFLHSEIDHEIYVKAPKGYYETNQVFKLRKSLYGLKQSPRNWYMHLGRLLTQEGFHQSEIDPCLFTGNDTSTYVLIYVDDICCIAPNEERIESIFNSLKKHLQIKNLGEIKQFLGWNIVRKDKYFEIHQHAYIESLISKYNLEESKTYSSPMNLFELPDEAVDPSLPVRELIGSLQYLAHKSRPDITRTVQFLATKMHQPTASLFRACKNVVRYLKGTLNYTLKLGLLNENGLELYTDSTYDIRAITGILVQYNGSTIMWCSRKQACQPTSTTESEIYALADGLKEICYFKNLLNMLSITSRITIYCDNRSAISIIQNGVSNTSKHILIRWNYIQELLLQFNCTITYCDGAHQLADLFTKELNKSNRGGGGMLNLPPDVNLVNNQHT